MISIIYSLFPVLYYVYYFIFTKKRKSVLFEVSIGKVCYLCKESLELSDIEILSKAFDKIDNHKLCKSCNREVKIKSLSSWLNDLKYKLLYFLLSKKWTRFSQYLLISVPIIILIESFLKFKFDLLSINLGTSIHLIYLYFWHQKNILTTIKKPSE